MGRGREILAPMFPTPPTISFITLPSSQSMVKESMPLKVGDLCYYNIRGKESFEVISSIDIEGNIVYFLDADGAWDTVEMAEAAKKAAIKLKLEMKYGQVM